MLFRTSNILKINGPVTYIFAIWVRMLFFLIDFDIQLILEFKNSFGKNCPFFPKNYKLFLAECFLDKQFCKNLRACNCLAAWLKILFFVNDSDINLILEFKDSFVIFCSVFLKILKKLKCKNCQFLTKKNAIKDPYFFVFRNKKFKSDKFLKQF